MSEVGEVMRILRGDRSLRDMEAATGISNAYWFQLESGKIKNPTTKILKMLCDAFPEHRKIILKSVGLL